jgi:hypothetical protein
VPAGGGGLILSLLSHAEGKIAMKHLARAGFSESGARIVSSFLGRNEVGLGGHKNRGLFWRVVGQAFF